MSAMNEFKVLDAVRVDDPSSKHHGQQGVITYKSGPFFDVLFPDDEEERFTQGDLRYVPTASDDYKPQAT